MRNILPRRRNEDWNSPWVETRGYKPNVKGLRAFGADTWVHRPSGQRKAGKLGSSHEPGAPGVLVLYDISTRLYTVDTVEYGVVRTMTCTFDESAIMDRVHARPADALRVDATGHAAQQQGIGTDSQAPDNDQSRTGAPDDASAPRHPRCASRLFEDSNEAGGSNQDEDLVNDIIPGQQINRNANLDRNAQRPAQTDDQEGTHTGGDPHDDEQCFEPCPEPIASKKFLDKRCVNPSDRNEPPAGASTEATTGRGKRPDTPHMTLRSSGGNGGNPEARPGAFPNLTKRPVTVFDRNRPTRQAALESGLSGVTGVSRASGGRYQGVGDDSRPPVRLIRDLFNQDELNGKYWNTANPTAEAHITENYPYLDWKLILEHADEPYVPDTPLDAAGTVAFVYAAVAETNKPTASEDLRTDKEAFPDDAGKVPVNDMRIPGSFDEAIYKSPQKEYWKAATKVEINAQINNQTVVEVPIGNLPTNINLIDGTWKYDAKADPETGLVRRYKARFCGRGDMQVAGVDYHETSSPVA